MNNVLEDLFYTKEHEWINFNGEIITIGITDFAQSQLGDIVYLELPEIGINLKYEDAFGVVESIKSVSDLFCPMSGEVTEINNQLTENPALINENPYQNWMIKIKCSNLEEKAKLLSSKQYKEQCI